ncbi:MAG: hypothetical protein ACOH2K_14990 [Burkholderiaceae bacterium]
MKLWTDDDCLALLFFRSWVSKQTLCRIGFHDGGAVAANFCGRGCGHAFNGNPFKKWIVTLRNGEAYEVDEVNEWHAGSKVVFGNGPAWLDARTGVVIGEAKVHRTNIVSAVLKQHNAASAV